MVDAGMSRNLWVRYICFPPPAHSSVTLDHCHATYCHVRHHGDYGGVIDTQHPASRKTRACTQFACVYAIYVGFDARVLPSKKAAIYNSLSWHDINIRDTDLSPSTELIRFAFRFPCPENPRDDNEVRSREVTRGIGVPSERS